MDTCAGRFFDVKRYAGIVGLSGSKLHPQAKDACLQAGDLYLQPEDEEIAGMPFLALRKRKDALSGFAFFANLRCLYLCNRKKSTNFAHINIIMCNKQ